MLHTVLARLLSRVPRAACHQLPHVPRRIWTRGVACAAATTSASAWFAVRCEGDDTPSREVMARLDLDGDGKVDDDWVQHTDPASGKMYFHNVNTGETVWEIPKADLMAKLDLDGDGKVDDEWEAHTDPASGKRYYHNAQTGATVWEKPTTPAAANELAEDKIRANIERMEAVVQLPSRPWPKQPPLHVAKAIEDRLLRVQQATRDLEGDPVGQAVLLAQARSEILQDVPASVPETETETETETRAQPRRESGLEPGGTHSHPWLLYSAFGLGVVAYIAAAYRVRGTVPGTPGQVMRARAEAAMARERLRANMRIAQLSSATAGDVVSEPRWTKQKWQVRRRPLGEEVHGVPAAPKPLPTQPAPVRAPPAGDRPSSLLARLDALPSRGSRAERATSVQKPSRVAWVQPSPHAEVYDASASPLPTQSVSIRASDAGALLAKLDALPSRAERAPSVQKPTAAAGAKRVADGGRAHWQSRPRGGNHDLVV